MHQSICYSKACHVVLCGRPTANEVTCLRESEESLKLQQQEAARRENILVMRLATKEQEMQECTVSDRTSNWIYCYFIPPPPKYFSAVCNFALPSSPADWNMAAWVRAFFSQRLLLQLSLISRFSRPRSS